MANARTVLSTAVVGLALAASFPSGFMLSQLSADGAQVARATHVGGESDATARDCNPLDNIFVINLEGERGSSRRSFMRGQFDKAQITDFSFMAAADMSKLREWYPESEAREAEKMRMKDGHWPIHDGSVALARSHQMAYEKVVENNLACAMVFEDDATLGLDFRGRMERLTPALPDHFHLIKLDYCNAMSLPGTIPEDANNTAELWVEGGQFGACAASYIISKEGAELFIKANTPIWMDSDGTLDPEHLKNSPAADMLPLLDFHIRPRMVWQEAEDLPGGSHTWTFSYRTKEHPY